MAVDNAVTV